MTVMETVLGGALLTSLSAILTALFSNRGKVTTADFEKHKESKTPHSACPVHEKVISAIDKKLDRVEEKVDRLLQR